MPRTLTIPLPVAIRPNRAALQAVRVDGDVLADLYGMFMVNELKHVQRHCCTIE